MKHYYYYAIIENKLFWNLNRYILSFLFPRSTDRTEILIQNIFLKLPVCVCHCGSKIILVPSCSWLVVLAQYTRGGQEHKICNSTSVLNFCLPSVVSFILEVAVSNVLHFLIEFSFNKHLAVLINKMCRRKQQIKKFQC